MLIQCDGYEVGGRILYHDQLDPVCQRFHGDISRVAEIPLEREVLEEGRLPGGFGLRRSEDRNGEDHEENREGRDYAEEGLHDRP